MMRLFKPLIKLLISIVLIWMIFRSVDSEHVLKNLSRTRLDYLAVALAVLSFQIIILAYRWAVVAGVLGHRLGTAAALRMTFIAQFFNQALPSTVGGDAVRIWLNYRSGGSFRQSVHSVIADRAVATAMLLAFVLAGVPLQSEILGHSMARWVADIVAVGSLGGFALCLALAVPLRDRFGRFRLVREIAEMSLAIRRILCDRTYTILILVLSALNHVLSIVGLMLLSLALGMQIGWIPFFVLVPLILLLSMIPISIGGWGLREGIMIAAFGYVGMPSESALSLSLLFGIVITVVSLPGSIFWLLQRQHDIPMRANPEEALAEISEPASQNAENAENA